MSERDYMAEFNDASSRSRDILIEAGGHINYLRSLLRELMPFLPKGHPWLPGINEQIEALPVDERDATIAALQAEVARYKAIALLRGWLLEPPSGETNLPKINVNGDARDLDVDLNANCWTALDVGEHSAAILIVTKFSDVCGGGPTKYGQAIIHQLTGMSGETSAPDDDWETPCPKRDDGQHCECWYGGNPCCSCGDAAILDGQAHPPCAAASAQEQK